MCCFLVTQSYLEVRCQARHTLIVKGSSHCFTNYYNKFGTIILMIYRLHILSYSYKLQSVVLL